MAGIGMKSEVQVPWTRDEIEAEAELRMVGIEDKYLKLPKLTHTSPTIPMYPSVQLHAEMSRRLRETDIRRVNLCLLRETASHLRVKHTLHHGSTPFYHQETRCIFYGTISLHPDEKTTTDEMGYHTSEAGMRMVGEILQAMIVGEAEVLDGIDRRCERGIPVTDIADDIQDSYRKIVGRLPRLNSNSMFFPHKIRGLNNTTKYSKVKA